MGCDGGTIPRRDELVTVKKKPEKKDKDAEMEAKWKNCQLTQEKLRAPIVACELGRLYNKESVLELLLDRSKFECTPSFLHIKALKDIKVLNLTENKDYSRDKNGEIVGSYLDHAGAQYMCPVVGLEMSGRYKFCFLWGCGCVVSQRAMKEVKSEVCHKCGKSYTKEDIVILNGDEDDNKVMEENMEARRDRAKLEKKAKKAQKHKATIESKDGTTVTNSDIQLINGKTASADRGNGKQTNGIPTKKSRLVISDKPEQNPTVKIQDDPSRSKVYKSLFTTSKEAKNQTKGHWVTFNPQYFH